MASYTPTVSIDDPQQPGRKWWSAAHWGGDGGQYRCVLFRYTAATSEAGALRGLSGIAMIFMSFNQRLRRQAGLTDAGPTHYVCAARLVSGAIA